jgi:hypothetical protein
MIDFINDCQAKNILLIIDSCFSGTFLTNTRNINLERTYSDLKSNKSRWIISSGSEEKVSDGVSGENSPFCRLILKFLSENKNRNCSVSEIFNFTQILINKEVKQTPQCNIIKDIGHEDGEFVLTLKENDWKSDHKKTIGIPNSENLKIEYLANINSEKKLSVGKEILIVKSIIEKFDFMILENFRFNEEHEKKISFKDNLGVLDSNDPSKNWEVFRRFATWTGLMNYLDSNKEIISKKTVIIRAHPDIENVEDDLYSKYYSQYLNQLFELNHKKMHCMHCEEKISDDDSFLIEFDDLGFDTNVGNVHHSCLRPIDRILGKSIYENLNDNNFLSNFDYEKWGVLFDSGQGQLKGIINQQLTNGVQIISWNPENNTNRGNYCIKINYDDGISSFMKLGNQIQRFTDNEISNLLSKFNDQIDSEKPCKIIESGVNGYFDTLEKLRKENQTISFVKSYKKTRYSKLFEKNDTSLNNDYSPLCFFRNKHNDETLSIGNIIPLITNPEKIAEYIENWEKVLSIKIEVKTIIVESDFELGNLIELYKQQNKTLVINPAFNIENNDLEIGLQIKTFDEIIKESKKRSTNLKKGDKVNIIINPNAPKLPFGILLEDEFIDEAGDFCSIFQPWEEGKPLDLAYKMPTKLMKKI